MRFKMNNFEYVNTLTSREKVLFVRTIIALIGEDGEIEKQERNFIKEIAKQYKISRAEFEKIQVRVPDDDLIQEAEEILDRSKSLFLIKELLTVANTDNDLNDKEIDFIIKLSTALNIEEAKVVEINQLVLDQINLLEKYNTVMEVADS